jgi:hypothetical protein
MNKVLSAVKVFVRNLPVVRKEIVAAATAGATVVGVLEVNFPNLATDHVALFAGIVSVLTGTATFLANNRVVDVINTFSDQPEWKAKLRLLMGRKC